ncbi:MAG: hypothetical protein L7F77_14395 [Candidatus Magnetominusculus sp. LBB02]|nr:hypothetical protein [Candidatus Magnetominusculus sp. LBB02]
MGEKEKLLLFIVIILSLGLQLYFNGMTYVNALDNFVRIWKEILRLLVFLAH